MKSIQVELEKLNWAMAGKGEKEIKERLKGLGIEGVGSYKNKTTRFLELIREVKEGRLEKEQGKVKAKAEGWEEEFGETWMWKHWLGRIGGGI